MIASKIIDLYKKNAKADKSHQMVAYMRGQFNFYGIPSPIRRSISKDILKQSSKEKVDTIIKESAVLWRADERELQYFAMDILDRHKKHLSSEHLEFGEKLITTKSWWDTVDYLSTHFFAPILLKMDIKKREEYTLYLAGHKNMWMNRVAMIFQLSRKGETETELLEIAILPHLESTEFFHQKAIGWALRQYSKTNPAYVSAFLDEYELSKLSIREASKYL